MVWDARRLVRDCSRNIHAVAFPSSVCTGSSLAGIITPVSGVQTTVCRRPIPQLKGSKLYKICGGSAAFRCIGFCFLQLHVVKGAKGAGVALDGVYPVPAAAAGGIAHLQPGPAIVNIPGGLVIQKFTCGKNLSTGIIPEIAEAYRHLFHTG